MKNAPLYLFIWKWVHLRPSCVGHMSCAWPESAERLYGGSTIRQRVDGKEDRLIRWCDLDLFVRRLSSGDRHHVERAAQEAKRFTDLQDYLISGNSIPRAALMRMGRKLRRWRAWGEREEGMVGRNGQRCASE